MKRDTKAMLSLFCVIFTILYLPLKLYSEYITQIDVRIFFGVVLFITGVIIYTKFKTAKKVLGY